MTIDVPRRAHSGVGDPSGLSDPSDVDAIGAIAARISAPPGDRDPLLWAAHESLQAARLLLEARDADEGDEHGHGRLTDAAAQTRSAAASLHYALRDRA